MSIGAIGRVMNFRRFLDGFIFLLNWLDFIRIAGSIRASARGFVRRARAACFKCYGKHEIYFGDRASERKNYTHLDSHTNSQSVLEGELRSNVDDNFLSREKQT